MHLRFETNLDFPELAIRINDTLARDRLGYDYENVYEWMYLDFDGLEYSLNVSREHRGLSSIEENQTLAPKPASYAIGFDRTNFICIDEIPDWVAQTISDKLNVSVYVLPGSHNVDKPDPEPIKVVEPRHPSGG